VDLAAADPARTASMRGALDEWVHTQLARSYAPRDPLRTILDEGGPFHVRGHLPAYLERLRATDRGHWADAIEARHPDDARARTAASSG